MKGHSLDRFIEVTRPGLYRFILSNVKNPETAEDITQDVLIALVKEIHKATPISNYKSYLFTIAKNQVINYWKKAAATQELKEEDWEHISQNKVIQYAPFLDQDQLVIFNHIKSQLTEQQQKIFFLNRKEGLSYSEISKELNISRSTVKNHMILALKNIRLYMEKNYDKLISLITLICFF